MTPDEIKKDRAAGAWCIVTRFFTRVWCDITHGGGRIERDSHGRINWRCARCGRWSDHPVPLKDERATVDREIQASISSRRRNNPMIKLLRLWIGPRGK